ncbi:tyrosinase family protein [Nevskia sp.]|uniref:tyrosinase family protein n=1 Tax=Nevskia sp. TaxID=1929292 RepID=UPI0025F91A2F|nr:tyrosinase family protein [Nevskia sp.]
MKKFAVLFLFGTFLHEVQAESTCCIIAGTLSDNQAEQCGGDSRPHVQEGGYRLVDRIIGGPQLMLRADVNSDDGDAKANVKNFLKALRILKKPLEEVIRPPMANDIFNQRTSYLSNKKFGFYDVFVSKHGTSGASTFLKTGIPQSPNLACTNRGNEECEGAGNGIWFNCLHYEKKKENYNAPLFLLWHRAFVRSFEISANSILASRSSDLIDSSPGFGIPFWNWTKCPQVPILFRSEPSPNVDYGCQSASSYFAEIEKEELEATIHPSRTEKVKNGDPVWTSLTSLNPFHSGTGSFPGFVEFSNNLQSLWHDQVHNGVGPHMARTETAVEDPLFWLMHSYVDKLWVEWFEKSGRDEKSVQLRKSEYFLLKKRWEGYGVVFPMLCNSEFVWYRPRFEEILPSPTQDEFESNNLPSVLSKTIGYVYQATNPVETVGLQEFYPEFDDIIGGEDFSLALIESRARRTDNIKLMAGKVVVSRLDKEPFMLRRKPLVFSIKLDSEKSKRLIRLANYYFGRKASIEKNDRPFNGDFLAELNDAVIDSPPSGNGEAIAVLARVCESESTCFEPTNGWTFLSFYSVFSTRLAISQQTETHNHELDHSQNHGQVFDISLVFDAYVRKSTRSDQIGYLKSPTIQIAIAPVRIQRDGTADVKIVLRNQPPDFSFRSASVYLSNLSE